MKQKYQYIFMAAILLLVVGWGLWYTGALKNSEPVALHNDKIHVHSDFAMYINGSKVDLTGDMYQSTTYEPKHLSFHLHDGVETMLHRHADGIPLGEFLQSIGFTLANDCLTTDMQKEYCASASKVLRLYVNGEVQDLPSEYITQEEDRILLYYGDDNPKELQGMIENITNEACIYSGTCPERGDPPFESCALTCEI